MRLDGTNVLDLDDPEIFQNPVLYVWEPGYWTIQPSEAEHLRKYLLKGGFVIFDDFEGPDHWDNMVAQMRQALPDHRVRPHRRASSDLPLVLQHQQARRAASEHERDARLLGDVREQRSVAAG